MKVVIVGLGVQGNKRALVADGDLVATVDPLKPEANFKDIRQVSLEKFDAALLCTPDDQKVELIEYLLKHKKHVLVEKPLISEHAGDLERVSQLAKDNKVTLYTAYNHRFEPHLAHVAEVIKSEKLGKLYHLNIYYGNGTARLVRDSVWRDAGMGIISDIGSHLFDLTLFYFSRIPNFKAILVDNFENKACDHCVMVAADKDLPRMVFEASMVSWRNTFRLDLFGERGSLHIDCLCKWGPSVLTERTRVLPSGRPLEEVKVLEQADPTWELEYRFFKELCKTGALIENRDLLINNALNQVWENK